MSELWRFSKDTQDILNKTRLPSGGWINLWLNIGHYEVTQEAAERFGFSSAAVDILRDASQDPDFYEFTLPSAHAQSPDKVAFMPPGPARDEAIEKGIGAYKQWTLNLFGKICSAMSNNDPRIALYWLGYVLHGMQDLGPHGGMANPEHAALDSLDQSPDEDASSVQLSRYYTQEFLRHIREALGQTGFDLLRNWDGDGNLSKSEKEDLFGHGWDLSVEAVLEFKKGGEKYLAMSPPPVSVRWPRERVFTEIVESLSTTTRIPTSLEHKNTKHDRSKPAFQPLGPAVAPQPKACWTVMVYMAGDDSNPNGIEYAVTQDLRELKDVGSRDSVHFLAQTDECREKNSYRYRLRKGTPFSSDRLGVYRGDLNTGRVTTLVDFVDWSVRHFPADNYALVLWGHGSGHDDQDVYRLARGNISPRLAARLAQERIGFFGRTRRAMLERNGPNKGYGFDSTATDFLDNRELKRAISAIIARIGKPLDLLGFDACLMANTEVVYQLRGLVNWMVASEQTEPGDGWSYREAFKGLAAKSSQDAKTVGKAIVHSFGNAYEKQQTLSLINVQKIGELAKNLKELALFLKDKDTAIFHRASIKATDLSPEGHEGYKDLGAFLRALETDIDAKVRSIASRCTNSYKQTIQANAGPGTGLTIYLPAYFNPYVPGSTDALYQLMDFPMECSWSRLLEKASSPPGWDRTTASRMSLEHNPFAPRFGGLYGMDRYNVKEILQGIDPDAKVRHWVDLARRGIFSDMKDKVDDILEKLQGDDRPPKVRIFML
ncbi:MAG: putative peptidase, partial [Deltaproteobacteria bacterium]|nr:putative peptidase [Deltaproteobacteria bacterium]